MTDIKDITAGIIAARNEQGFVSLLPYVKSEVAALNEYLLFLKPELASPVPDSSAAIELVFERLSFFGQRVTAASVLHAGYIERHKLMDRHYGVINAVSRNGPGALSPEALAKIGLLASEKGLAAPAVMGAHEFLVRYPYFSPKALAILSDNMSSTRVAPGVYGVPITLEGRNVLVLNAFHPEQLERYTTNGAIVVAFVVTSTTPWVDIRGSLTGSTNPERAPSQSIRGSLLRLRDELGLAEVNTGANGVHVSAGPVEAMVEITRFMSDLDRSVGVNFEDTNMGRKLVAWGLPLDTIRYLCTNPQLIVAGKSLSLFDATEELNTDEAVQLLIEAASHLTKEP